jgi:hypothetical protein
MAIGSLVVNNKNSDQNHAKNAKVSIFMMDKVATSNNSVSMYLDTSVPPESVLEQQVAAKVRVQ